MNNKDMSQDSFTSAKSGMKYAQLSWEEELRAQQRRASTRRNALRREPSEPPPKNTWLRKIIPLGLLFSALVTVTFQFDLASTIARVVPWHMGEASSSNDSKESSKKRNIEVGMPNGNLNKTSTSAPLDRGKTTEPVEKASGKVVGTSLADDSLPVQRNLTQSSLAGMVRLSEASGKRRDIEEKKIQKNNILDTDSSAAIDRHKNISSRKIKITTDASSANCPDSISSLQLCGRH